MNRETVEDTTIKVVLERNLDLNHLTLLTLLTGKISSVYAVAMLRGPVAALSSSSSTNDGCATSPTETPRSLAK